MVRFSHTFSVRGIPGIAIRLHLLKYNHGDYRTHKGHETEEHQQHQRSGKKLKEHSTLLYFIM